MSDDYMPTTEEVRSRYQAASRNKFGHQDPKRTTNAEFERWLADVKARAWLEGHAAGRDYQGDGWNSDAHDPEEDNPYRQPIG